ncbi:MAG: four-carbon acid sugar kinase family protein [Planctomycetales bacterium]|nr:four-carbon acid sugar kinase family protein [Planctomycetales bacterium]
MVRIAFYGDDFTGSTDALEWLARANLRSQLFLQPPHLQEIEPSEYDAIGIAGFSRSLPPAEMEQQLRTAFAALQALSPSIVHYKVCSTFDSSPQVGSIGRAIEVGLQAFENATVPILVGSPELGRYCVFGNLFAQVGIGSDGDIYRIDRHPVMRNHPVTPATDGDLRRQLTAQTELPIDLVDVLQLEQAMDKLRPHLQPSVGQQQRIVLFDTLTRQHLTTIGQLLDEAATRLTKQNHPLFVVGSSAVESALTQYWRTIHAAANATFPSLSACSPILVLSGSCSSVTAEQIDTAVAHGFEEVTFDSPSIFAQSKTHVARVISRAIEQATLALKRGRSVVIHTAKGPTDARLHHGANQLRSSAVLGAALGQIAGTILRECPVQRIGFAGGDTSSHAVRTLGITSLSMRCPFVAGAPICLTSASDPLVDAMEINLKGGQVGAFDYFVQLRDGV